MINKLGYTGNLILSTSIGTISYGVIGGVTGLSATILDEYLIKKSYIKKHILSTTSFWSSIVISSIAPLTIAFPAMTIPLNLASIGIAATISYLTTDPLNYPEQLENIKTNLMPVVKLFDKHNIISEQEVEKLNNIFQISYIDGVKRVGSDVNHLLHNKVVNRVILCNVLGVIQAYSNSLIIQKLGNNATILPAITLIASNPNAAILDLSYKTAEIMFYMFLYKFTFLLINYTQDYFLEQLGTEIRSTSVRSILFNKEYIPKLLTLEDKEKIIHHLPLDFCELFNLGINKLLPITTGKFKELIALKTIINMAPENILIAELLGIITNMIIQYLEKEAKENTEKYSNIETEHSEIVVDITKNLHNLIPTKYLSYVQNKLVHNIQKIREIQINNNNLAAKHVLIKEFLHIFSQGTTSLYYMYKILLSKTLPLEQAMVVFTCQNSMHTLLTGLPNQATLSGYTSKNNIDKVLKIINTEYKTGVIREYNNQNILSLKDYNLLINGNMILNFDYLTLDMGKHYAISGESGIGKSSLFKDIAQGLFTPFYSSGTISLPIINNKEANLFVLDQNLYIPSNITLLEAITLTEHPTNDIKEKVILLLKILYKDFGTNIAIENNILDIATALDMKFKPSVFSGGQLKKIGLVKAILANPDILILDEVFANMDDKSIKSAQEMLIQYLPNAMIIVIDHKAESNNFNHFYDYWLVFKSNDGNNYVSIDINNKQNTIVNETYVGDMTLEMTSGIPLAEQTETSNGKSIDYSNLDITLIGEDIWYDAL